MLYIALKMLMADRAKYTGLLLGIAFTAFLVTFAAAYFSGFMTRGFALIAENGAADVWVMDAAVESVEQTINMPDSALDRIRGVEGVRYAVPLALGTVDARFPNGRFQTFQVIGVDDATLAGAPVLKDGGVPTVLRAPDAAIIDDGGTSGKLLTPVLKTDQWPHDGAHLEAAIRELAVGDELLANDQRIKVVGRSETLPRFPPRPLIYTTFANAARILPQERHLLTFVLATAEPGLSPNDLAQRIHARTGLRARASEDFKTDTVRWYLVNSEDVGDMAAMLILAMSVGFGVTGVLLYIFTYENLKQYAVLNAMGATPRVLLSMIFAQTGICALTGTGLGLGACVLVGEITAKAGYPFRMMWFTPLLGTVGVLIVSLTAAAISARPVLKLQPAVVFAGR
ncbi:MAG: ABC transporter permease [Gammaproteobacteria bacterium]|nr:ABC transporter permease [Gammaproteobacteria bacterium]